MIAKKHIANLYRTPQENQTWDLEDGISIAFKEGRYHIFNDGALQERVTLEEVLSVVGDNLPERNRENYILRAFQDTQGKWRWGQRDKRNGKKVGASSEGYVNFYDMWSNLYTVTGFRHFDEIES